ncbi:Hypothetical protein A7982_04803 [Minicystis rosea]|nr:Hypothetical protein A7982_04803 [Minicystis rosea]
MSDAKDGLRFAHMERSPFRARRLAPGDVRRILRRAAELAEHDASTRSTERSLTQDEIERLGVELGLPATAIRDAIRDDAELADALADGDTPGSTTRDQRTDPRRIVLENEIEGEISASYDEDVVETIATTFGDGGRTQLIGRTLTWTPTPEPNNQQRQLTISVRTRDGYTRIRIDERLTQLYYGLFLGMGLGIGIGGGVGVGLPLAIALRAPVFGLVIFLAFALVGWILPYLIYGAVRRRRIKALRKLMAHLRAEIRKGIDLSREHSVTRARIASGEDAFDDEEAEAETEADVSRMRRR